MVTWSGGVAELLGDGLGLVHEASEVGGEGLAWVRVRVRVRMRVRVRVRVRVSIPSLSKS